MTGVPGAEGIFDYAGWKIGDEINMTKLVKPDYMRNKDCGFKSDSDSDEKEANALRGEEYRPYRNAAKDLIMHFPHGKQQVGASRPDISAPPPPPRAGSNCAADPCRGSVRR